MSLLAAIVNGLCVLEIKSDCLELSTSSSYIPLATTPHMVAISKSDTILASFNERDHGPAPAFISANAGVSWSEIKISGLPISSIAINQHKHSQFCLGTLTDGVYESHDNGASWQRISQTLKQNPRLSVGISQTAQVALLAGTPQGIFRSTNSGKSWEHVEPGPTGIVNAIASRRSGH